MTEDDGLAPATSEPNIKVMLMDNTEYPQVILEWRTPVWMGPDDIYHVNGQRWMVKWTRKSQEPDGTHVYELYADRL